MITLHDILTDLTYGEFTHLNIGNFLSEEHESEPDPKSYARFASNINLGLKAIYSEFLLATGKVYIQPDESINIYTLSYDYATTNTSSTQPTKYIIDTVNTPFEDNVLKIEGIIDADDNVLFLEDKFEEFQIKTPNYRSIELPWPNEFVGLLTVQYRATHPKILFDATMLPEDIEVAIPHALHEALLFYVASRQFSSLRNENGQEGNDFYQKYQAKMADVRRQGLYIQKEPSNWRFNANGWV